MTDLVERYHQRSLEQNRRRVFVDSYLAASMGWTDTRELSVFAELGIDISRSQLRDILDYLEGMGLIEVDRLAVDWHYSITALGMQSYEGNAPWPLGVAPKV